MVDNQGYLTPHVLDTVSGGVAKGMQIELYRLDGEQRTHIKTVVTDDDGRTDGPILSNNVFSIGNYESVLNVGEYLDRIGATREGPRFLSTIPIRFGISSPKLHYHVPLLISPFGNSTYLGS